MPRSTRRDRGTTTVNANSPPAPFAKAAERLNPFLDTLDPERLYIVHLDRLPWEFKRQIFAVPVFLNVVIVIILLWRWYTIVPAYLELAAHFLRASPSINASFAEKVWLTLRRAVMFGIDFVLIRIIMPWPISFFLEQPANPVKWRRRVRFQDVEIIVRESRAWGAEELLRGGKKGEESPFFKTRVLPAVERRLLTEKTGYSMMGKDWDLDFASMINAAELCRKKELEEQDFETTVLAHDEVLGWLSWVVYKDEQAAEVNDRDKLVNFKVCSLVADRVFNGIVLIYYRIA